MSTHIHNAIGWLLVLVLLGMVGFWVPPEDKTIGNSYLIFFIHFPSAIDCLVIFVLAGICSLACLTRRGAGREEAASRWEHWSVAGVEVGMLACTITLVTGGVWARAAWGDWDTWITSDPRLLSVYIMWFTYAGYLAMRASIEDARKRQLFCAVFGIIATVNVPITYFAIRIFKQEHHPMAIDVEAEMRWTMWFGAFAFLVLYTAIWRVRRRLYHHRHELDRIEVAYGRVDI